VERISGNISYDEGIERLRRTYYHVRLRIGVFFCDPRDGQEGVVELLRGQSVTLEHI
jgi:hypothetical protein